MTLKAGLVCIGSSNDITYTFSIPDDITTTTTPQFDSGGSRTGYTASFNSIEVFQGTLIRKIIYS